MKLETSLIYGVGVNDTGSPASWAKIEYGERKRVWCPYLQAWRAMLQRCYDPKFHKRNPSYASCSVCTEWHTASNFVNWMKGKDWKGKHLDKDLLCPGNKIYSPEKCVFISPRLNKFTVDRAALRGEWPIGVHFDKRTGRFMAICANPFVEIGSAKVYLGRFDCPKEAHAAWKKKKHEYSCAWADMQDDERLADALRKRYL